MKKIYKDHIGNIFSTKGEMCRFWGISTTLYIYRVVTGLSMQEALETKLHNKIVKDHKGNVFNSFTEMCSFWDKGYDAVRYRISRGWSIEDALTIKTRESHGLAKRCEDHMGKQYSSLSEMCTAHNIGRTLYMSRINNGLSVEQALTKPVRQGKNRDKKVEETLGAC